jgi:hypothetical protein
VLAYAAAAGYGLMLLRRLVRGGREARDGLAVLLFAWGTLVYLTAITSFGEVLENQRLRFCLDPLVLLLDTAAARELLSWLRRSRQERSGGLPESSPGQALTAP